MDEQRPGRVEVDEQELAAAPESVQAPAGQPLPKASDIERAPQADGVPAHAPDAQSGGMPLERAPDGLDLWQLGHR